MWIPFLPIASLTTGLLSSSQHSIDISLGATTRLKQTDLSTFAPYIEFARAAYCDPNKIVGWKCGGLSFLSHLDVFTGLLIGMKMPATLFQTLWRI